MSEIVPTKVDPKTNGEGRGLVIGAVMLAMFTSAISQTVVSTALPRIVGELGGLSLYSWVLTASMLAATAAVPLVGKLSDLYGRKPFLMGGIVLFMAASAITGASQNIIQLIIFRALQGLGSGTIMATSFATIGDLFAPAERGRFMGLFSGVYGMASVAGPLLGGFLTDNWGWRWVFYVNVPFGLMALVVLAKGLQWRRQPTRVAPIDWLGMVTLLWSVLPFLLALVWAGDRYPWASWQVGSLFATAAAGLAVFLAVEVRAADPVLPLRLFRNRTFAVASAVTFLTGIGLFGALSYMPLFIQGVLGKSATNSGLVNTPLMVGMTAASLGAGNLASRTKRYRWMVIVGGAVLASGMLVMALLDESSSLVMPLGGMVVVGLGLGLSMPLLSLAVQNAFEHSLLGVATSSSQFFRQIGGTLGIAVYGTLVTAQMRGDLSGRLPQEITSVAPSEVLRSLEEPRILLSPSRLEQLEGAFAAFGDTGPALYEQTIGAMRSVLADGLHEVFLLGLIVAAIAMAVSFFLPDASLREEEDLPEEDRAHAESVPEDALAAQASESANERNGIIGAEQGNR